MFLGSGKKDITTNRTKRRNQAKKEGMQSLINFKFKLDSLVSQKV